MNNLALPEFWERYGRLPTAVQRRAEKNFALFRENPEHPSLRFKPLAGYADVYSVRVGLSHRAVARRKGGNLYWFWIGSHADFDREFA